MDILHGIESKALVLRETPPAGTVMEMAAAQADIELTMERPLFTPAIKPAITQLVLQAGDENIDPSALFDQVVVDKVRITRHINHALQDKAQITLYELLSMQPLQQGLAELIAYLQLGSDSYKTVLDEDTQEPVRWQVMDDKGEEAIRIAHLPRVIFMR